MTYKMGVITRNQFEWPINCSRPRLMSSNDEWVAEVWFQSLDWAFLKRRKLAALCTEISFLRHGVLIWQEGPRASEVAQRVVWRVDMNFPSHSNSQVTPPKDRYLCMFQILLLFCFFNSQRTARKLDCEIKSKRLIRFLIGLSLPPHTKRPNGVRQAMSEQLQAENGRHVNLVFFDVVRWHDDLSVEGCHFWIDNRQARSWLSLVEDGAFCCRINRYQSRFCLVVHGRDYAAQAGQGCSRYYRYH